MTLSLFTEHTGPINALVMGASGGIGFELTRLLAADKRVATLLAIARNATTNADLRALSEQSNGKIVVLDTDITDEAQLANMASTIAAKINILHLAINTAGMLHTPTRGPEKMLSQLTLEGLQQSFAINAFGPILLAKSLLPFFKHSEPVIFASLSARVGSISDNRLGGWYSYRAAKAAQNQLLKTLSIELTRTNKRSIVVALHPGTTDTPLSKPFQANVPDHKLFTPAYAAQCLLDVIAARRPEDSGGFYGWDGEAIPW